MNVEYVSNMGSDLTVVNAARVSFDKESNYEYECTDGSGGVLKSSDERLIHYLARHNHWTPFSHGQITLRETVPIFVARQRFKHTVGFSYNEVSRRYVDTEPSFYIPLDDNWRKRNPDAKQGSLEETVPVNPALIKGYYDGVIALYNSLLESGIAPEQARMVLPQSLYTSYYVTGSLSAFARAFNLRSTPDAQSEIQYIANRWDEIISNLYHVSWKALTN